MNTEQSNITIQGEKVVVELSETLKKMALYGIVSAEVYDAISDFNKLLNNQLTKYEDSGKTFDSVVNGDEIEIGMPMQRVGQYKMLTEEQKKVIARLEQMKKDVLNMNVELVHFIDDGSLKHIGLVLLDRRDKELKVYLSGVDGIQDFEEVIYQGKSEAVAKQIAKNLLKVFHVNYAEFDEDGVFRM
ncbi:hypothetical protein [Brevibacillus sp. NRS-1366]|uniref:hypothetical protein n=1 Tax=Brevibacillus sp. NRS-1366 TaxID=3233899 RepID=UPI003D2446BF